MGPVKQVLRATHPFEPQEEVWGCPKCRDIGTLKSVCDAPHCTQFYTCGWPSPKGYRQTCFEHWKKD